MSINKRRWSNEFHEPLMDYRSKDASEFEDSFECDSGKGATDLLNTSTDISNLLANLNIKNNAATVTGLQNMDEEHSACTSSTSNDNSKSENNKPVDDLINFSSIQDHDDFKENSLPQNIVKSSKEGPENIYSLNLDEKITKNITLSSDSGTIKLSSCNSSTRTVTIMNVNENQINEGLTEVHSEDKIACGFFSSPVEFPQNNIEMLSMMEEPDMWDALIALEDALSPFDGEETKSHERSQILNRLSEKFKATPTRFTEKLVSIIEDSVIMESPLKQNPGNVSGISLDRMSGEFRKMCKFIADESMPDWTPSLMNMTTLNKTETPELEKNNANSNNETPKYVLKSIKESPCKNFTPKPFKAFATPKNTSRNQTPINRFTPSADKSFEYWETVCNTMYKNQGSAKKNVEKTSTVSETSKLSMDEILTICERQMASLDDSTIDARNSEPYKNTDSVLKLQLNQVPRSKSVSKIDSTKKEKTKSETPKKIVMKNDQKNDKGKSIEHLKLHSDFDILKGLESNDNDSSRVELLKSESDLDSSLQDESEDSYRLSTRNISSKVFNKKFQSPDFESSFKLLNKHRRSSVHQKNNQVGKFASSKNSKLEKDKNFGADFEKLPFSPPPRQLREKLSTESFYDNKDDQDCSLLVELAKRRQRCLETAKLMLEIDKEDPSSDDMDKTCLETLYKLGIQDKTFPEIKEDTKFINTLNHCFEYKNYIRDKSNSIMNMLQKCESSEIIKKKATSAGVSKKLTDKSKAFNLNAKSSKVSTINKPHFLDPRNSARSCQITTPAKKPLLKACQTSEKKNFGGSQVTVTSRVTKKPQTSNLQPMSASKLTKKSSLSELSRTKANPKDVTKAVQKTTPSVKKVDSQSQIQSKNIVSKLSTNMSVGKTSKATPKLLLKQQTPFSETRPILKSKLVLENESPVLRERNENVTPVPQHQKRRLFVTPGKSPNVLIERKKPTSYFGDGETKKVTPQRDYNKIESPLCLYIKGTDAQLIQNAQTRTNDRLLTPVSKEVPGESPKLKFNLASKENTSPAANSAQNIILPPVRYQSAKKVCLTDDESPYALQSLVPNSRTKKLLEPIEKTVVIRHEGRVVDYRGKLKSLEPDMSIHAQHVAEKASITRRKYI